LGNPGKKYEKTRHNIGFMVLDRLAQKENISFKTGKYEALFAKASIDEKDVAFLKPLTYMNRSGRAVSKAAGALGIDGEQMVVVHDDLDLPFGRIRFRLGGSAAGHNGIKSIQTAIRSDQFVRVRVGIGRPEDEEDPADYVLTPFNGEEREKLPDLVDLITQALHEYFRFGLEQTMSKFNRKDLFSETDE